MAEGRDSPRFDFKTDANSQNLYQGINTLNINHYHADASATGPAVGRYAHANPNKGAPRAPAGVSASGLAVGNYTHVNSNNGLARVPAIGNYLPVNPDNGSARVPGLGNYAPVHPYNGPARVPAIGNYLPVHPDNGSPRVPIFRGNTRVNSHSDAARVPAAGLVLDSRQTSLSRRNEVFNRTAVQPRTGKHEEKSADGVIASKGAKVPEKKSRVSLSIKKRRGDGKKTERRSPSPTVEELLQTFVDAMDKV